MSLREHRVRWEITERGPRVIIDIGGEEVSTTMKSARELRDDLSAVLAELRASEPAA